MPDDPRRHPLFLLVLAITVVGGVPFLFVDRPLRFALGLPTWLWSSIAFSVLLSTVTAWGILRYFRDDGLE